MTTVYDETVQQYSDRVKGKVVLITGAAGGIGRETALLFAKHGAKIVIEDLNTTGGQNVVDEITNAGGAAVFQKTDVLNWDDQVGLFDLGMSKFGCVDVAVVNAGVTEIGNFEKLSVSNGKLVKPQVKTVEINLIGSIYTTHCAMHYLPQNQIPGSLKAVVLLGSMASWVPIPQGEMYTASKHGVLGFARSVYPYLARQGIRMSIIHPWFADTPIVPFKVKVVLAGLPMVPIDRIAKTIFVSATDPDMSTSGSAYVLLDDGLAMRLEPDVIKTGVYKVMDARAAFAEKSLTKLRLLGDLWRLLGKKIAMVLVPILFTILYTRSR